MELKPGYKQTEVGVIPEEWDSEPCSRLCVKIQDGTHFSPTICGNDYLYLTSKNVRFGYLDVSTADRIDAAQHETIYKRCDVKHGDLLLTKDGANTGNAALNTLTEQFSLLSSVALLRFDPKHHSAAYFLQQCLSAEGQQRMKDAMSGNAITRLTLEKIRKLRFPVAPLPEQRAIATALSDVDGLLGGLDRLIAKKRDLKQAAMQQLLTGQTRLPGFHGEWEVKTFGEVAVPRRERIDPKRAGAHDFCIELEHIESESGQLLGSTSTGAQSSLKSVFRSGDVLFGKLRAYLRKYWRATRSGVCSTEIWVLVPRDEAVTSQFLFQIIQTDDFIDAASNSYGTHMPRSDWNVVKNHELKMPLVPEQTAIASVLTEMDAELAALEQRREKTRALKQAMMQELLTGRTRLV